MYKLYRKEEKSTENEFGISPIEEGNPFEQPVFLSLLAINQNLRNTNGSISRILELAGIRTPNGEQIIQQDEVPVQFLGLSYSELGQAKYSKQAASDNSVRIDEDTREFTLKYLLPLLVENGQKRDITECCRNMRNINIMCYCDALFTIKSMSKVLEEEMAKLGFTQEEIDKILAQVCIISVGAELGPIDICVRNTKFTTILITDLIDSFGRQDEKTTRELFGDAKEAMFNTHSLLDIDENAGNKHSRTLLVNDSGEHDLKSFIKKGVAYPAIIIQMVNTILMNSVKNNTEKYIPLELIIDEILPKIVEAYIEAEKKGMTKEEIVNKVLASISYSPTNEKKI